MAERDDKLPPIKYAELSAALLDRATTIVPAWLPGGVQRGHEYVCGSLSGGAGTSCSVNLNTGAWADFAADEKGGDLLGLYAAIHDLPMWKAALEVARAEGLEDVAGIVTRASGDVAPRPPRPAPPPKPAVQRQDEGWRSMMPVPDTAPAPTFKHQFRQPEDIEHTATYSKDGALLGYVVRFRTSDGGKDTLPYTWCVSARDGAARWHWKQWDEPRPLYLPGGKTPTDQQTVVLVEGEKKAGVLQSLLDAGAPGVYVVVSWPGGSKAWKKAAWQWLTGRHVLLWPDCDGKREPLTKKEIGSIIQQTLDQLVNVSPPIIGEDLERVKEAAIDLAAGAKPLLPKHKQPGMSAMLGIGTALELLTCTVRLLPIPEPLAVPDGWDCADAILTDGWDFDKVIQLFGQAQPLPKTDQIDAEPAPEKKRDGPGSPGASDRPRLRGQDAFQDHLDWLCEELNCEVHALGVNRKLVVHALRNAPALCRCLGLNLLTGAPSTQEPWPWRDKAGPLEESDALRLGDWLSTTYHLKAASKAALEEAIDTVADERRFHPVRDWLTGLEWDGTPRLDKWLIHILGKGPAKDRLGPTELDKKPKLKRYHELVGRFLLMGLVARVMEPGCKFDYSPVFEGLAGRGKSTLVKTLVGADFFSDTHFDIGSGKDGMEQLEGLWGYELSELTALRKADSEQVKQFFSSTVDRFRGAYGKYVQAHPRQCVIFCSTNKKQYLYDLTGNRRFWPIWIEEFIKLEWLRKWRSQLFAEAFARYKQGERYVPTQEEEREFFEPEQNKRLVETAVQSRLYELLTREGASGGEATGTKEINIHTTFITLDRLVAALGTDAAKSSSLLETQIRGWLEAHGWTYGREGGGLRRRGYKQPSEWPPKPEEDDDADPPAADSPSVDDGLAPGTNQGNDDYEPF